MNTFQRCIATSGIAWLGVVVPVITAKALQDGLLWNLSFAMPAAALTAALWLAILIWLGLIGWAVVKVWTKKSKLNKG